jgi:acetyl/propionyl-CoA carboxylase alpha subunit
MKQVLVANRGEIAVRIISTLRKLGIHSVAIYHDDEYNTLHAREADFAVSLGNGTLTDTYLNINRIIHIAKEFNCDGIHPGYGFLSENHLFAKACEEHKIKFIGPDSEVIRLMGLKSEAKKIAQRAGVPVFKSVLYDSGFELSKQNFSFPLIIKAVAGGGGKGMKIVHHKEEFNLLVQKAFRESEQYFGNNQLMIEPYLENARHVEVQVIGDNYGNVIHLFERECSLQRNHQKIIEEAPATSIDNNLRAAIHTAAIRFTKELNYTGVGTVEFLVSGGSFYFLEMNTRIQVEHPVTEMITKIDLVKEQILIARGEKLSGNLYNIQPNGHAIEGRLYAENPYHNFRSSSGNISLVSFPENARVDSFIASGIDITPHFDSMLGKIIVHGKNRGEAIKNFCKALKSTFIHGVETNLYYLYQIARDNHFINNTLSTSYLEEDLDQKIMDYKEQLSYIPKEVVAFGFVYINFIKIPDAPANLWHQQKPVYSLKEIKVIVNENAVDVRLERNNKVLINNTEVKYSVMSASYSVLKILFEGKIYNILYSENQQKPYDNYEIDGIVFKVSSPSVLRMSGSFIRKKQIKSKSTVNQIVSPLFGKIIDINVKEKDKVKKGDVLLTIESMKTENNILSPTEGIINSILVQKGIQVHENKELITLNPKI